MADTTTTAYGLTKPEVGASEDTWGTKINTDFDSLDTIINAIGGKTAAGTLSYADSAKLVTSATGVDITGTLTADDITLSDADTPTITLTDTTNTLTTFLQSGNSTAILGTSTAHDIRFQANSNDAIRIANGGDISFYEDTGTTPKFFWDASAESLGIGTSSPSTTLEVKGADNSDTTLTVTGGTTEGLGSNAKIKLVPDGTAGVGVINAEGSDGNDVLAFQTNGSEAMRLDASGNLLVGKTALSSSTDGFQFTVGSSAWAAMTNSSTNALDELLLLNRTGSDGEFIQFKRGATTVGIIGTAGGRFEFYNDVDANKSGLSFHDRIAPMKNGTTSDNTIDLGEPSIRFDDIYATNGTIQTSDRNEKQDIAELSDAEQRVAVAAKGLMRKFRWRDAVEAKGDDARTHFGIIAQDLQAAFAAEGLDAGDYAMFISTTWWETQTEVPAVEAVAEVLDEEGNVVTEAVEAVDAYTRTDTYDTQEEAPEGATERTRLGVRYSELLAFIIAAI